MASCAGSTLATKVSEGKVFGIAEVCLVEDCVCTNDLTLGGIMGSHLLGSNPHGVNP